MPDYYDAAQRHIDDAHHLLALSRLPNADHLFGVSAECALKAIMLSLGMPMTGGRPQNKNHGHINVLWDEFISFANGRGGAKYATSLGTAHTFCSWDVSQRYENTSTISVTDVMNHKESAGIAFNCLVQAVMDGVV